MKDINVFRPLQVDVDFNVICPGFLQSFNQTALLKAQRPQAPQPWQLWSNPSGTPDPKLMATGYVQLIYPLLLISFLSKQTQKGHCPVDRLSGEWRGVVVESMPKVADGVSPEWLCCCATIMGRLRIAQALGEEMLSEQQWQQQQLRGPATQLLGKADGTCP